MAKDNIRYIFFSWDIGLGIPSTLEGTYENPVANEEEAERLAARLYPGERVKCINREYDAESPDYDPEAGPWGLFPG